MAKISILGAGSCYTYIYLLLHNNGNSVTLWSALEEEVTLLQEKREHPVKLPGVRLSEEIFITSDLKGSLTAPMWQCLPFPPPLPGARRL